METFLKNIKGKRLATLFNEELKTQVTKAIAEEEKGTSGEVVVMIAPSSAPHSYIVTSWTIFFIALLFVTVFIFSKLGFSIPNTFIIVGIVLSPLLAMAIFQTWPGKRFFLDQADKHINVLNRAHFEFYRHRLHHTDKSTGVLIFISLLEREAVVWGDELISQKLPQETWQKILNQLIVNLKVNNLQTGLVEAISEIGKILKEHFLSEKNDQNELSNELILLDS